MTLVYQSTRDAKKNTVTASQKAFFARQQMEAYLLQLAIKVDLDFETVKDASYQEVAKYLVSLLG